MSDFSADDEWFEDMLFLDTENLPDTLAPTAYAHSPPYAPDTYDAYDSDYDEYLTSGDDSYFDGSPPPGSPPPLIKTNTLTPPTLATSAQFISRLESRYRDAMQGKKFYGEQEVGDEMCFALRRRKMGRGGGGARKRRRVLYGSGGVAPLRPGAGEEGVSARVVEIGSRSGEVLEKDDDGSASAEGYNSDRDLFEEQLQQISSQLPNTATTVTTSSAQAQLVIRPPVAGVVLELPTTSGVGGGARGGGGGNITSDNRRWAGGTGRRRQVSQNTVPPPAAGPGAPPGSGN